MSNILLLYSTIAQHLNSDIALIKLPDPVEFDDVIKPVSFGCYGNQFPSHTDGMDVIAIGNGITEDNGILQYIELNTASILKCLKTFSLPNFRKSAICVKGKKHNSTCVGDSGGPLVTLNNSLIGVTNLNSPKGCENGAPNIFTKISFYVRWIQRVSGVQCQDEF